MLLINTFQQVRYHELFKYYVHEVTAAKKETYVYNEFETMQITFDVIVSLMHFAYILYC